MITLLLPFLFVALFITEIFLIEFGKFGWSTLSLIVTGVVVYHFKLFGIPEFVATHAGLCLGFIAAYIVVGVIWSFIKWYSFLIDYRSQFTEKKEKYVSTKKAVIAAQSKWIQEKHIAVNEQPVNLEELPLQQYNRLHNQFTDSSRDNAKVANEYERAERDYVQFKKPLISNHKGAVIAWMCFWPFSLVGTFINDPLRRLFTFLFNSLKTTYQKMSDSVFSDFPDPKD